MRKMKETPSAAMMRKNRCAGEQNANEAMPPTGLMVELMAYAERTVITDRTPEFSWIVNSGLKNDVQTAYQVLVGSSADRIRKGTGDMWDSGKVDSSRSIGVEYVGKPLEWKKSYWWGVRTWTRSGAAGPFSAPRQFNMADVPRNDSRRRSESPWVQFGSPTDKQWGREDRYPPEIVEIPPDRIVKKGKGHYFVDFGRAAFATISLTTTHAAGAATGSKVKTMMEVRLGEKLGPNETVDTQPGGSVLYRNYFVPLRDGKHTYKTEMHLPTYSRAVCPFRYCEILNCPSELGKDDIRQVAMFYPFHDEASFFTCSDKTLNDVWDLCKYSIKATSFLGVYIDGNRERKPYEADAYINQLGHYYTDREFTLARYSTGYLIEHPTWPTEWILHSVLMAWADYMHTGDAGFMRMYYDDLKAKTLHMLAREDGLISAQTGLLTGEVKKAIHFGDNLQDIVDWPDGERNGYKFRPVNTVVNAFHYRALVLMARIAEALKQDEDAGLFQEKARLACRSFNEKLFDDKRGIYVDGEGADHASLHANMFALALGLAPEDRIPKVAEHIKSRGMACSVYGAQYLLEALYLAGEDEYALSLMNSKSERSWAHMIYDVGSTITLEAWDRKCKENLDWNHAWGAAPANIIPRYLMGVKPVMPGFGRIRIRPQVGALTHASIDVPTIRGTVHAEVENRKGAAFSLFTRTPANTQADVHLPAWGSEDLRVTVDGEPREGVREGRFVVVRNAGSGEHRFERRIAEE